MKSRGIVSVSALEVAKQIMMNPGPLRHGGTGRARHHEHLPLGVLVLKAVVINLIVVARDDQIGSPARHIELEYISGNATVMRSRRQFDRAGLVSKLEPAQNHVRGARTKSETGLAIEFHSANTCSGDFDRLPFRPG